jgi:16S rRNA processing protein RimM
VGRPHGLDGSFVVDAASDAPERFDPGAPVWVGREPAVVVESKRAGGRLVVKLDRAAERGAELEVPAAELPPPAEGEFYVFQLVGAAVHDEEGRHLGVVVDVVPGVANDVLELDTGSALPLVEDCVLSVDLEAHRVVVASGLVGSE